MRAFGRDRAQRNADQQAGATGALAGDSALTLQSLSDALDALAATVTGLTTAVSDLTDMVDALADDLAAAEDVLVDHETRITALEPP